MLQLKRALWRWDKSPQLGPSIKPGGSKKRFFNCLSKKLSAFSKSKIWSREAQIETNLAINFGYFLKKHHRSQTYMPSYEKQHKWCNFINLQKNTALCVCAEDLTTFEKGWESKALEPYWIHKFAHIAYETVLIYMLRKLHFEGLMALHSSLGRAEISPRSPGKALPSPLRFDVNM